MRCNWLEIVTPTRGDIRNNYHGLGSKLCTHVAHSLRETNSAFSFHFSTVGPAFKDTAISVVSESPHISVPIPVHSLKFASSTVTSAATSSSADSTSHLLSNSSVGLSMTAKFISTVLAAVWIPLSAVLAHFTTRDTSLMQLSRIKRRPSGWHGMLAMARRANIWFRVGCCLSRNFSRCDRNSTPFLELQKCMLVVGLRNATLATSIHGYILSTNHWIQCWATFTFISAQQISCQKRFSFNPQDNVCRRITSG